MGAASPASARDCPSTDAPASSSTRTHASWPFRLANISAVRSSLFAAATLAPRSRLVEHVLGALCAVLGTGQNHMPELVDANPVLDARAELTSAAWRASRTAWACPATPGAA